MVSPQTETLSQQYKMVCGDTDHEKARNVKWSVGTQTMEKRTQTIEVITESQLNFPSPFAF